LSAAAAQGASLGTKKKKKIVVFRSVINADNPLLLLFFFFFFPISTILAQLGAGVRSARYAMAGAVAGAFIHGYTGMSGAVARWAGPGTVRVLDPGPGQWKLVALGAACLAGSVGAGRLLPERRRQEPMGPVTDLTAARWNPTAAGVLMGVQQLTLITLAGIPLGTSTAYSVEAGKLAWMLGIDAPVLRAYFKNTAGRIQYAFDIGILAGAAASTRLSGGGFNKEVW
jgi:hypothetical protein